jgi:hypothetical protein
MLRRTAPLLSSIIFTLLLAGCVTSSPGSNLSLAPSATSRGVLTPTLSQGLTPGKSLNIPDLPNEVGKTWLEINPKQCGRNPWEQELRQTDSAVPERCQLQCESLDRPTKTQCIVQCLVERYYAIEGIEIFNLRTINFEEKFGAPILICEACDCPAGYTLYVQVTDDDVPGMLAADYRHIITSCETANPRPYGCK